MTATTLALRPIGSDASLGTCFKVLPMCKRL